MNNKNKIAKPEKIDVLIGLKEFENPKNSEMDIIQLETGLEEIENILSQTESYFFIKESEFIDVVTVDLDNTMMAMEQFKKSPSVTIKKIVPIDLVVPSMKEKIIENIIELASEKIDEKNTFVVKCELRSMKYLPPSDELIQNISNELNLKMNINYNEKNADWVIAIEELGHITGISICKADNILILE